MKVLALIPARGGSKGVPGKNIKPLAGVPLIGYTIRSARAAGGIDLLRVSTDDPAIARVAESFGVSVPWLRPAELARDDSSVADALRYDLERLAREEGFRPDAVLLLQATSPFRGPDTIRRALELFEKSGRRTVLSVTAAHNHPFWCYRVDENGILRPFLEHILVPPPRQKLPPAFVLDGSICVIETERFLRTGAFFSGEDAALVVPAEEAVDIDTPADWAVAEAALALRGPSISASGGVFVIAEAGVNHNGDLATAKALVDAAREAGADAVKFQTFKADKLVAKGAPKARYQQETVPGSTQFEMIKALELDEASHRALQEHARKAGILFLSTPFDEESVDLLDRLGVPIMKIPSGEITNKPLLRRIASKGKPMILSTGMSTLEEVGRAVSWIREVSSAELTLLHCLTEYPAPLDQVNLRAMNALRAAFALPVGYSDHTHGIEIPTAAAALGASVIEKHLTLDKNMPGPDHRASLEPAEFKAMVSAIRVVSAALGDGVKRVAPCEEPNRAIGRRSVVAARALASGHRLAASDLAIKRPGSGIPPASAEDIVGRTLKTAVAADEVLTWEVLS